jgi:hypothetical protein
MKGRTRTNKNSKSKLHVDEKVTDSLTPDHAMLHVEYSATGPEPDNGFGDSEG